MGEILVGTSGFSFDSWGGIFYPPGLPKEGRLRFYAQKFRTVELNVTFYRLLSGPFFLSLAREAGPGFAFSAKVYAGATHVEDW